MAKIILCFQTCTVVAKDKSRAMQFKNATYLTVSRELAR